jgi:hypothetical protein
MPILLTCTKVTDLQNSSTHSPFIHNFYQDFSTLQFSNKTHLLFCSANIYEIFCVLGIFEDMGHVA